MTQLANLPIWAQILSLGSFMFASGVLMTRIPFAAALILLVFGLLNEKSLFPTWSMVIIVVSVITLCLIAMVIHTSIGSKANHELASAFGSIVFLAFKFIVIIASIRILYLMLKWHHSLDISSWLYILTLFCFGIGWLCGILGYKAVEGGFLMWFYEGKIYTVALYFTIISTALAIAFGVGSCLIITGHLRIGLITLCIALVCSMIGMQKASHISQSIKFESAIKKGDVQAVSKLLSESKVKADMNFTHDNNIVHTMPISLAIDTENAEIVKILIDKGADVNAKDSNGNTPLINAINKKSKEIVKILIQAGADINEESNGLTVLQLAVIMGCQDIVPILIQSGADVNAKDDKGHTILIIASANKNKEEMVKVLIQYGADVNAQDNNGETALMMAAQHDEIGTLLVLLANGADVNAKSKFKETALIKGVKNKHPLVVKELLNAGANPQGCLVFATIENSIVIVRLLLEKGVFPNEKDIYGKTALQYAQEAGYTRIAKLLKSYGAKE